MEDIEQKEVDLKNNDEGEVLQSDTDNKDEQKAEAPAKREYTTEEKLARVSRLKQRYEKELGIEPTVVTVERKEDPKPNTGELNETQLDYLDVKGITSKEDIEVIQAVMKRTGQTLRQTLSDEYVQTRLKANKDKRDIDNAMPGGSKRASASSGNDVAWWVAENERSGRLPDDFDLRVQVIEAKQRKAGDDKTPPWLR